MTMLGRRWGSVTNRWRANREESHIPPQQKTTVRDREVLSFKKVDRADGYDWQATLRFTYTNDAYVDWVMSGSLSRNPTGLEWKTDFNIENPPSNATPDKLIRSIATKINYHSSASSSAQPAKRPATVEMTFINGDGQERRTTSTHLLSGATVEPSLEELLGSVTNSVVNLQFPKFPSEKSDDS
ncbi:MAG: hypothetical protein WCC38_17750 [Pseudonocardiaceae bacterium]